MASQQHATEKPMGKRRNQKKNKQKNTLRQTQMEM